MSAGAVTLIEVFAFFKQEYSKVRRLSQFEGGKNTRWPTANDNYIVAFGHNSSHTKLRQMHGTRSRRKDLFFDFETLFEAFYLPCRINYALLACEKWVAITANFDFQNRLSCSHCKSVTTRATNSGIFVVFRVDVLFHRN